MALSKLHEKCKVCPYVDMCNDKKLVACACIQNKIDAENPIQQNIDISIQYSEDILARLNAESTIGFRSLIDQINKNLNCAFTKKS